MENKTEKLTLTDIIRSTSVSERVHKISSNEEKENYEDDEMESDENRKLLSLSTEHKDYKSIPTKDYSKKSLIPCSKPCLFFIGGAILNVTAITFLSMRVSNSKKFDLGLKTGAHLGIFISMAVIGIVLMTIGYALIEYSSYKEIAGYKSTVNQTSDQPEKVCVPCYNKTCVLFILGGVVNAVAIDFLSLRVANPQQFSLGLEKGAHLGIFISMAIIGIALMGAGYFSAKQIYNNLVRTVISPNQPEEETDSLYLKSPIEHKAKIRNIDEDDKENIITDDDHNESELQTTSILNVSIN